MNRLFRMIITHGVAVFIGFALGVYFLPILTAPEGPDKGLLEREAAKAEYTASLTRDLPGSDFLHWGEGTISIGGGKIVHMGKLAPGPDYKLYLVPGFVDDEASFEPLKADSVVIGDVKTFDGFILEIPGGIDLLAYDTVLVWCESFGEFITAARYR